MRRGFPFQRLAELMVPPDDRGEAILGDWAETHSSYRERHRRSVAAGLLGVELLRSLPSLAWVAARERGWRRLLSRTLPAIAVGNGIFLAPLTTIGFRSADSGPGVMAGLGAASILAMVGGWAAAALADAAPRAHALGAGISVGWLVLATGLRVVTPWQTVALALAAMVGGVVAAHAR
ncbi:MAG: hypothetical protein R2909_24265, partial [Gemmatimonadales bacterium]